MILVYVLLGWLVLLGLACARLSDWHSREAAYWYAVDLMVRREPLLDEYYRPVLDWCKAHPPHHLRKVVGWEPPPVRVRRGVHHEAKRGVH